MLAAGETVVVGVSGGVDSLTLLHVLLAGHKTHNLRLHVATLDHGTRGTHSAADADYVRTLSESWGVPVTVARTDVPALARQRGMSLEEAARQVRYGFLRRVARQVGAARIAVGHNRDDQAETVLMHLIRGSGLSGLRGMLPVTPLSTYHVWEDVALDADPPLAKDNTVERADPLIIRPLIEVPRAAIEAYAAEEGLQPREDPTNADITYFRNRLRHEVLPLLANLNPNIRATLARTAEVLRADAELVSAAGEAALERTVRDARMDGVILDLSAWGGLALAEKRSVLRALAWRLRPDLRDVSLTQVDAAVQIADEGDNGAAATLPGGLLLRVGRDILTVGAAENPVFEQVPGEDAPALEPGAELGTFLPDQAIQRVVNDWIFELRPFDPAEDEDAAIYADPLAALLHVPAAAWLKLRTRTPGDRFSPHGLGGHSQKIGDTFNSMGVPAAWRDRVPLFTVDDQIAWFVAPSNDGLRGRVAAPFARSGTATQPVVAFWRWDKFSGE